MRIRRILAVVTVLALAATIGASPATAQSQSLKARIPFEFHAAGELFPAGAYALVRVNPGTLRLQDASGRGVFIAADPATVGMSNQNWYEFHQVGNQRFLAGAYWAGSSISPKIRQSREIAKGGRKVTVAAR